MKLSLWAVGFVVCAGGFLRADTPPQGRPDLRALQAQATAAKDAARVAHAECSKRVSQLPEWARLAKALEDAQARRDAAKAAGSTDERFAAVTGFSQARKALSDFESQVAAADPVCVAADAEVKRAIEALATGDRQAKEDHATAQAAAAEQNRREGAAKLDAQTQEVTAKQIEIMGERFTKSRVKLTGCKFSEADNDRVDGVPGVTITTNGLVSLINTKERKKWVGFRFDDAAGNTVWMAFGLKDVWADQLVAMKRGTKINVYGFLAEMNHRPGEYGLICDKIEVVSVPSKGK